MLPEIRTAIPGPRSRELAALLGRYESRHVTFRSADFPIFWRRAQGTNVWDVDGNRFLDFSSAFGVTGLGHGCGAVVEAVNAQAKQLFHAMGDVHPTEDKATLCERLSEITFERWGTGTGKTILGLSGSDAIESALKTSLLYSGNPGVLTFNGGYHGLGLGATEVAGIPFFREPFTSQLGRFSERVPYPSCCRCPYGRTEAFRLEGRDFPNCSRACMESLRKDIEKALKKRPIGCILVEPMQGRGGEIVPPRDFLPLLRQICDERKILLVFDEILTGFNRTGKLFACEHSRVYPDIICLGKGLASGFPISACVGRSDIMDAWPSSSGEALHTSTFLGHPVGSAASLASINEHLRPETATRVDEASRHLRDALQSLSSPSVGDVRGLGLLLGIELVHADGSPNGDLASRIVTTALRDGFILLASSPHGNVLCLAPPFCLSQDETEHFVKWLEMALRPGAA